MIDCVFVAFAGSLHAVVTEAAAHGFNGVVLTGDLQGGAQEFATGYADRHTARCAQRASRGAATCIRAASRGIIFPAPSSCS